MPQHPGSLASIAKSIGKSQTPIPEERTPQLSSLGLRTNSRSSTASSLLSSASPPPPSPSPGIPDTGSPVRRATPAPASLTSSSSFGNTDPGNVSSNVLLSNILMKSVATARPNSSTTPQTTPLRPRQRAVPTTIIAPSPVAADAATPLAATFQAPMVFLGGSCHPTSWRQTQAIPQLSQAGISYFNPQIDNWSEAFMVLENIAKEGAEVLLFVIDPLTRAIASMLEATELISRGRTVVLCIESIEPETVVGDEVVTGRQLADLNRARNFLRDLGLRNPRNCAVFDSVDGALKHIIEKYSVSAPEGEGCNSSCPPQSETPVDSNGSSRTAFIVQQNYDAILSPNQQESFQKQLNRIIHETD